MKIESIKQGMIIKSYRELCALLDINVTGGYSKIAQIKEFGRYFKYHKDGNKYIIDEVYDEPLERIDRRGGSNVKDYNGLDIDNKKVDNIGVYKISLENNIYIGSTVAGFKKRFQSHYYGYEKTMSHTYELLQLGGKFEILHDMTGIDDEQLVRMVESEYIKEYLLNPEWNVINKKDSALTFSNYYSIKNKAIKIREDKYYEAIQLLAKHGLIDREGFEL